MKTFLARLNAVTLRILVYAQVMASTEPVRMRAVLTSLVVAGGVIVPALANGQTAATVAGIGVAALTFLAGESARSKVSPTNA